MISREARELMPYTIDLRNAVEANPSRDMIGYVICIGVDYSGAHFVLNIGPHGATVKNQTISIKQDFEFDGTIDYDLVITKALALYALT